MALSFTGCSTSGKSFNKSVVFEDGLTTDLVTESPLFGSKVTIISSTFDTSLSFTLISMAPTSDGSFESGIV